MGVLVFRFVSMRVRTRGRGGGIVKGTGCVVVYGRIGGLRCSLYITVFAVSLVEYRYVERVCAVERELLRSALESCVSIAYVNSWRFVSQPAFRLVGVAVYPLSSQRRMVLYSVQVSRRYNQTLK